MTHREEIWNKAQKALFEKYGESPDISIASRFLSEKRFLADYGVAEYFDELAGICRESIEKYNEKLIAKNTVSCCFTAYLLGASEINPLPPHYYCETCKRVEREEDEKCLFDMRSTRTCERGAAMRIDGYDIPWEIYLPYGKRLKTKDTVPETCSDLYEELIKKHFQWSLPAQAVNLLGQATGVAADEIDLSDREVKYRLLGGGDFSSMHPKLADFLKQAYTVVQPCSYAELLKLIGLAHGTGTWRHNGEDLLKNGQCRLVDIPATRDEIFMMIRDAMQERGVYDTGFAYDVAEKARKGYYAEHGMDEHTFETLKDLFGDWYASYLLSVRYMSTKALSVLELKYITLLTWYQIYHPKQFSSVIDFGNIWEGGENNG
jgi:DNA polymerase III alpha subunit (gram-positive type)